MAFEYVLGPLLIFGVDAIFGYPSRGSCHNLYDYVYTPNQQTSYITLLIVKSPYNLQLNSRICFVAK